MDDTPRYGLVIILSVYAHGLIFSGHEVVAFPRDMRVDDDYVEILIPKGSYAILCGKSPAVVFHEI